jgi:hypothetical protein
MCLGPFRGLGTRTRSRAATCFLRLSWPDHLTVTGDLTRLLPVQPAQYVFPVHLLVARYRSGEGARQNRDRGERGSRPMGKEQTVAVAARLAQSFNISGAFNVGAGCVTYPGGPYGSCR